MIEHSEVEGLVEAFAKMVDLCDEGEHSKCDEKRKWLRTALTTHSAKVREEERERILRVCDKNSFLLNEDVEDFVVYLTDIAEIVGLHLPAPDRRN